LAERCDLCRDKAANCNNEMEAALRGGFFLLAHEGKRTLTGG